MIIIRDLMKGQIQKPTAMSLGKFDGIHRGHELLLNTVLEKQSKGYLSAVFTFDSSPKAKVTQEEYQVLTTNSEKQKLLEKKKIDYLIECPFTDEIMHMEAEDFIRFLVVNMNVKLFVVGDDFRFGYQRRGNYRMLQELAEVYDYEVKVVKKLQYFGRDISSTYIREEIQKGHMETANELLGYGYFVEGEVSYGNQIGRTIGIPTANLIPDPEKLLPPFGVYAAKIQIEQECFCGIANIGRKPTIEKKGQSQNPIGIEMHILDFNRNIYGQKVKITFYAHTRCEKKFESISDLKAQMEKDIVFSREYFSGDR